MTTAEKIERPKRKFVPEEFSLTSWENIKPYFDKLLTKPITSLSALLGWLKDRSELESIVSEDLAWRYIKMTCYTENEDYRKAYQEFIEKIQPQMAPIQDQLNKKVTSLPFLKELEEKEGYDIMIRSLKKEIEIFREANIPVFTEINSLSQQYGKIVGAMTIEWEGKEITLQQAAVYLMSNDRDVRESVYHKVAERRGKEKNVLNDLFSNLVILRHQVATQADFENFRDYMFKAMGRFDYTPKDCFEFHEAIANELVPLLNNLTKERKENLGVDQLRPWDKSVDAKGLPPMKPFSDGEELAEKTIEVFRRLDPYLGKCLAVMKTMGHLDLESRKGKAPGGYNYPLAEIGVPFIFMNATSTLRDMVTIMHEGGHAVHNFLTRDLELNDFKSTPSEVAELASMAMELISMDHWDVFFEDEEELKRAKREHLEDIIETLPWVATIDQFQHWIYENPNHTLEERKENWNKILSRFSDSITDWSGLEDNRDYLWQKQLHLFEVPFYYIEYGMAQLGAIAVWRNFRKDPKSGLEGYQNALKLGYLRPIPEIYQAAGIRFDFSQSYIRELVTFVKEELGKI